MVEPNHQDHSWRWSPCYRHRRSPRSGAVTLAQTCPAERRPVHGRPGARTGAPESVPSEVCGDPDAIRRSPPEAGSPACRGRYRANSTGVNPRRRYYSAPAVCPGHGPPAICPGHGPPAAPLGRRHRTTLWRGLTHRHRTTLWRGLTHRHRTTLWRGLTHRHRNTLWHGLTAWRNRVASPSRLIAQ
jgi:hypothetical protein